jgi:thioesterase domain-containing protein
MAAYYVQQMKTLQPKGPYTLGGRCFGGTIAFEMARQLVEQGEQVGLLALFGSAPPGFQPARGHLLERLAFHREQGRLLPVLLFYLRVKVSKIPSTLRRWWSTFENNQARRRAARSAAKGEEAPAYMARYVPRVYPGRITLFDTTQETRAAWTELAGEGVDLCVISGTHHDVFLEPGVHEFADRLAESLKQAQQKAAALA